MHLLRMHIYAYLYFWKYLYYHISQGKLRLFEAAYPSGCYLDVNLVWNMEENSNHIVRGFW